MNEQENGFKALRETLGMSQSSLANSIGVNKDTIRRWENGQSFPQGRFRKKLQDLFFLADWQGNTDNDNPKNSKIFYDFEELKLKAINKARAAIAHSFTVGKCYSITDTNVTYEGNVLQKSILRYERKEGIHHVFREIRGNWIVTYTDSQLVGKFIKEVEINTNGSPQS